MQSKSVNNCGFKYYVYTNFKYVNYGYKNIICSHKVFYWFKYNAFLNMCLELVNTIFWSSVALGKIGICSNCCLMLFFILASPHTLKQLISVLDATFAKFQFQYLYILQFYQSSWQVLTSWQLESSCSIGNISWINKNKLFLWSSLVISALSASIFYHCESRILIGKWHYLL